MAVHLNTTGSGTAGGTTWATAFTSWTAAVAAMVAGDVLNVDVAFNTSAAGLTLVFPGTAASPNQVLSGTPAVVSGLTALSAGAQLLSSTPTLVVTGSFYMYGVTLECSSASNSPVAFAGSTTNTEEFDTCKFRLSGNNGASGIILGSISASVGSQVRCTSCSFRFANAGQQIRVNSRVEFYSCSIESGGTSPTTLFSMGNGARGAVCIGIGFDFTNLSSSANICAALISSSCSVLFSDCKMPASWSGVFQTGTTLVGCRSEFYAFDNAATSYRFSINDFPGSAREDATIYLTGSTTDGGNISDKFTTSANVVFPAAFRGRWYYQDVTTTGSSKTGTVQCARNGSATPYKDNEVWMELEYFSSSGTPLGAFVSDRMADVLSTPANQAAGTGPWTGLGGTNVLMALATTFTPQMVGYVRARVCVAVASISDLYVDPVVVVT